MKTLNALKKAAFVAVGTGSFVVAQNASAAGWDYSSLTSSIDFSSIATGVLAVAALLAAVYAGIKGARIVLGFLKA